MDDDGIECELTDTRTPEEIPVVNRTNRSKTVPSSPNTEERAIRASGTVAGATILGGAIGSLAGPLGTYIGAGIGAAGGVALSLVSASRSHTRTSD